jgi:3-deoxy-manno-octulosonate cytidylyltransferase (CMP-KDO synthetase)
MLLTDVICVLPARLSSTRIPRKLLESIAGKPLLEWAWRAASSVPVFDRVVVATDSIEIEACARAFDAEVIRTRPGHRSGTDRVQEAADLLSVGEDAVVVNFQADEPFVDTETVGRAVARVGAGIVADDTDAAGREPLDPAEIATLAAPIRTEAEWRSPGTVKIARAFDGRALYFSRSPIPFFRDAEPGGCDHGSMRLRHIGVYACRRAALRRWASLDESPLERCERLEQLRALEAGIRIHVEVGPATEAGVDLPADLERAERVLSAVARATGGVE